MLCTFEPCNSREVTAVENLCLPQVSSSLYTFPKHPGYLTLSSATPPFYWCFALVGHNVLLALKSETIGQHFQVKLTSNQLTVTVVFLLCSSERATACANLLLIPELCFHVRYIIETWQTTSSTSQTTEPRAL